MKMRISVSCSLLISTLALLCAVSAPAPTRLTDDEFWKFSSSSSEEDGTFNSDNLVSNEFDFQDVMPDLLKTASHGGIYIGVGPEQNFTYMAALKPSMAIILDIRRGNLDVHLMYKALFELSADRADFVSRLFSRARPDGLTAKSTVPEIFAAYQAAKSSKELFDSTFKAIVGQLKMQHGFPLSSGDVESIQSALANFYQFGLDIDYNASRRARMTRTDGTAIPRGGGATYASLMVAQDKNGEMRSYLATEENFQFLKDLQRRNMVVPVVADFAGPKAIREIGEYLNSIDATVSVFYLSNVESYLDQRKTRTFLSNVSTLPLDENSTFIRSHRGLALANMLSEVRTFQHQQ
jgi:hypothetical protein